MEHKERKVNRLPTYDYRTHGAYFVTICTQDRNKILSSITKQGISYLKPIGVIAEYFIQKLPDKYPLVVVDRYVIMPDHIHILLRITSLSEQPTPTLGTIIGWYKYQVTKSANQQMNTPGERVFQRSYYDHVIRCQQDFVEIWQYIENNPKKWIMQRYNLK